MNWGIDFYEKALIVNYRNQTEKTATYSHTANKRNYYYMLWLVKGRVKAIYNDYSTEVSAPSLILGSIDRQPKIIFDGNDCHEFTRIEFHNNLFSDVIDEADFLRGFKQGSEKMIFSLENAEYSTFEPLLYSIKTCVFAHYNLAHMLPRVQSLVSEICVIYDAQNKDLIKSTDSIVVKVIDYINRHYTEKITLSQIQERFFISKPTVNAIIRRYSGKTFAQYLRSIRMRDAKKMLKGGEHSVEQVSELCGYPVYSTFYRAYVHEFGVTPVQDLNTKYRNYWPLTKKKK